ncbi:MAG TPA: TIGR00266 family protein [Planctomycetaceae bacterium]|nr:TIGR00266 family protein [Planctomycetaceae bacterium]
MRHEIMARPAATVLKVNLDQGESLTCEVGAMIAMSSGITVETTSRQRGGSGGIMKGLKRMFSGESFFLNHFTAQQPNQTIYLGPSLMGDVMSHPLDSATLIVQGSSWLASDPGIVIDTSWQGFGKALFSGESMFWVKCSGTGNLFVNSFGAIYEVDVNGHYTVDTGHIVAFEDSLTFKIGKAGQSLIGSFLGGEGLVCKFEGQGKLFCQSHNPPSFGKLLGPKLRPR